MIKTSIIKGLESLNLLSTAHNIAIKYNNKFNKDVIKHKKKMLKFYSGIIKKNDLVFDVGANMGKRTEVFLELGGKVVAIEPQDLCFKVLRSRFKKNKKLKIMKKGLASKEGKTEINICLNAPELSSISDKHVKDSRHSIKNNWTKKSTIKLTTLDKLIEKFGIPKFCKIDVEGFEIEVLKGLNKRIPFLCFEISKEFLSDTKKCIDLIQKLQPKSKYNVVFGSTQKYHSKKWLSKPELIKIIKKEKYTSGYIYVKMP